VLPLSVLVLIALFALQPQLDAVTGGSFELGNIIGSIAKATLPLA
jgi:hypothetical protein